MKKIMKLMFLTVVLANVNTACVEDGPLPETPDADLTPIVPDAVMADTDATPAAPDATLVVPDATTPGVDATLIPPDATAVIPDAAPIIPDAAPIYPDATPSVDATVCAADAAPACSSNHDCDDGFNWTDDWCVSGGCAHSARDCGGMQLHPPTAAALCSFWAGFGIPEPAPLMGSFPPNSLPEVVAGNGWRAAPEHACSIICYNPAGVRVPFDLRAEWNGSTNGLQHQEFAGLLKGTFDGLHLEY